MPLEPQAKRLGRFTPGKTRARGRQRHVPSDRAGKRQKTKFEQYLEMEQGGGSTLAEEEKAERHLAKRLGVVENGAMPGVKDGLELFLDFGATDAPRKSHSARAVPAVARKDASGSEEGGTRDVSSDEGERDDGMLDLEREGQVDEDGIEEEVEEEGENEDGEQDGEEVGTVPEEDVWEEENEVDEEEEEDVEDDGEEQRQAAGVGRRRAADSATGTAVAGRLQPSGGAVSAGTPELIPQGSKYAPPAARLARPGGSSDPTTERLQRRIRGLLNRVAESNVEGISSTVCALLQEHPRGTVSRLVVQEVLAACRDAPRGSEQHAAVFTALCVPIAAAVGVDFSASLLQSLAALLEEQYSVGRSTDLRNLVLLLSNLYNFRLITSGVVLSFLHWRCRGFRELDIACIVDVLHCCGPSLRSDDPAAMKEFILDVHSQAATLRAAAASEQQALPGGGAVEVAGGAESGNRKELHSSVAAKPSSAFSKRVEFMLETITDIKNNLTPKAAGRGSTPAAAAALGAKRGPSSAPSAAARLQKWAAKKGAETAQVGGATWELLLRTDKPPRWWVPGAASGHADGDPGSNDAHSSALGAVLVDAADAGEGERLLALAAEQRMNTDARRAVFCAIMGSEDCVDAFERLLRLQLPGRQEREVARVLVECCLQERVFNKFYALLAARLCAHSKQHRFSFQYCLWDHFALLAEMEPRRSVNLAKLTAHLAASHSLSLSVLKVVDLSDTAAMKAPVLLHFRLLFDTLLMLHPRQTVWSVFSRLASPKNLSALRSQVTFFLSSVMEGYAVHVVKREGEEKGVEFLRRCRLARKALLNVTGAPMPPT